MGDKLGKGRDIHHVIHLFIDSVSLFVLNSKAICRNP